jgi:hypothetical protein
MHYLNDIKIVQKMSDRLLSRDGSDTILTWGAEYSTGLAQISQC